MDVTFAKNIFKFFLLNVIADIRLLLSIWINFCYGIDETYNGETSLNISAFIFYVDRQTFDVMMERVTIMQNTKVGNELLGRFKSTPEKI